MHGPEGFYIDCDTALCSPCAHRIYGPDLETWPGFEDWESPLAIFADTESDSPTHCARCEEILGSLTSAGYAYVAEYLRDALVTGRHGGRLCILRAWFEVFEDGLEDLPDHAAETIKTWPLEDEYSRAALTHWGGGDLAGI